MKEHSRRRHCPWPWEDKGAVSGGVRRKRKSREHWAFPSGALVGSSHVLSAPTALGKMKLCPHLGGGKDEGERGSWGTSTQSLHPSPRLCPPSQMLAEEEECRGKKAERWWQGGGNAGSEGGGVTNVWSSCPVHRVPDPLPPGQQQPQHVHNGGGGDHGEAVHSSQTDPGVGIHLQSFGQDETPLGAATGGHCHHH